MENDTKNMDWLDNAVHDYVKNNNPDKRKNLQDIWCYFNLRLDIVGASIKRLEDKGRLVRKNHFLGGWDGHHHYEAL